MPPERTDIAGETSAFRRTRRNLAAMAGIAAISLIAAPLNTKKADALARPNPPTKGGNSPSCFLAGTHIATLEGPKAVETLRAGDQVATFDGSTKSVVRVSVWHAHRLPNRAWRADVAPVRIARSAIADNIPARDIYLSPNHALYLNGELVVVSALVNGLSIVSCVEYGASTLTYCHIELETHDVVVAEGLPVETFLGAGMTPYAPSAIGNGRRAQLASRARSALALAHDARTAFDRLRDQIEDRAHRGFAA